MTITDISSKGRKSARQGFFSLKGKRAWTLEILVGLAMASAATLSAEVLDLTSMTAADGVKYLGPYGAANAGVSAVGIGDLNGDGFGEAVIGAPGNYIYTYNYGMPPNPQGNGTFAGSSYVVFGAAALSTSVLDADLYHLSAGNPAPNPVNFPTPGFRIDGRAAYNGASGASIVPVGDVNDDGMDDFVIGAKRDTGDGMGIRGRAYLIFGNPTGDIYLDERGPTTYNFLTPTPKGIIIKGTGGELGADVAALGDFNGDNIDDFAIGAPALAGGATANGGSVFVIFGSSTLPATLDLSALGTGGFVINGENDNDYAGLHIAGAGDFNGDHKGDLIIGNDTFEQTVGGTSDDGGAFIVFGRSGSGTLNLRTAANVYLKGLGAGKYSGIAVDGGGDVNGDGFGDVIVGTTAAYNATPVVSTNSGMAHVVFGGAAIPAVVDLLHLDYAGIRIYGKANDYAGSSVAIVGDVNNDGIDDILVGAEGAKNGAIMNTGAAYLVYGDDDVSFAGRNFQADPNATPTNADDVPNRSFLGVANGDKTGRFVGPAGDMNNDGVDDFFIGAPFATPPDNPKPQARPTAGIAYLLFGINEGTSVQDWQMF